jgi:hypothetical protein
MQAKLSQLIKLFLSKPRNVRGVLDNLDQADLLLSWMRDCILIRRGIVMQQGPQQRVRDCDPRATGYDDAHVVVTGHLQCA